jgi:hypothetical protein
MVLIPVPLPFTYMSIILGDPKMPYCCAAKSKRKERGAMTRAVEWVTPILRSRS